METGRVMVEAGGAVDGDIFGTTGGSGGGAVPVALRLRWVGRLRRFGGSGGGSGGARRWTARIRYRRPGCRSTGRRATHCVCSVTPDKVRPIVEAAMDGRESTDPRGLDPPTNGPWLSSRRIRRGIRAGSITSANRSGFMPDLAGEYVGQLVVTNTEGIRSEPCEPRDAEPAEALDRNVLGAFRRRHGSASTQP